MNHSILSDDNRSSYLLIWGNAYLADFVSTSMVFMCPGSQALALHPMCMSQIPCSVFKAVLKDMIVQTSLSCQSIQGLWRDINLYNCCVPASHTSI